MNVLSTWNTGVPFCQYKLRFNNNSNNNDNEILEKCEPLVHTRAQCTAHKNKKTSLRLENTSLKNNVQNRKTKNEILSSQIWERFHWKAVFSITSVEVVKTVSVQS